MANLFMGRECRHEAFAVVGSLLVVDALKEGDQSLEDVWQRQQLQ
jgi:hypothetical protein